MKLNDPGITVRESVSVPCSSVNKQQKPSPIAFPRPPCVREQDVSVHTRSQPVLVRVAALGPPGKFSIRCPDCCYATDLGVPSNEPGLNPRL